MPNVPLVVCIDIVVVIIAARSVGALFRRFGQPSVVGEIVAGIALGPSVLGAFPGQLTAHLFPAYVRPSLNVLAQIGVVLFMFIVGLEANFAFLRGRQRVVGGISFAAVGVPFGLGVALATYLYEHYRSSTGHTSFILFVGAAMSVTAFPVLARILSERRMMTTELGALSLACAAADDVAAWTLLAVVVAVVQAKGGNTLWQMLLELAGFVVFMVLIGRPVLRWLLGRDNAGAMSMTTLAVVLAAVLASAWVTGEIGIDLIFGGFICGASFPKDRGPVIAGIVERIESVTLLLLLPLFFVVAGLSVNVRTIGVRGLVDLLLVLAVAVGGKWGGTAISARLGGITTRRSLALGVLMNTRGLTELVILSVGLKLGVLDERLFTLLVLMAIVTTIATGPLFRLIYPDRMLQADIAEGERLAAEDGRYEVMVVLDNGESQARLLATGADLAGPRGEVTLVRFLHQREQSSYAGGSAELLEMAVAMENLSQLAATVPATNIRPMALFSADAAREVGPLARRRNVDALVLKSDVWREQTLGALATEADCDVVVADGDEQSEVDSVTVVVGRDRDSEAAVELAVRVCLGRALLRSGVPELRLVIDGGADVGHWRRLGGRLRQLGLDHVSVVEARDGRDPVRSLLVIGAGTDHNTLIGRDSAVLRVYGHDDPQRVGMDQRILRLAPLAAPMPAASNAPATFEPVGKTSAEGHDID